MFGPALLAALSLSGETPLVVPLQAEEIVPENTLLFHLGNRELADESLYDPVDHGAVLGIEFVRNFRRESRAGLGLELGLFGASDAEFPSGPDVAASFAEGSLGLRGRLEAGPVQLFAGAGPTFIVAWIDIEDGPDEHDSSAGFYAHAGAILWMGDTFGLGLDLRTVTSTDISFSGLGDGDADYSQFTLVFGWNP